VGFRMHYVCRLCIIGYDKILELVCRSNLYLERFAFIYIHTHMPINVFVYTS